MTDMSGSQTSSETDCDIVSNTCSDDGSDEDVLQHLEADMLVWLQYCRIAERMVRQYLVQDPAHRFLFLTTRSGHIFMLQNMHVYPQTCFQEFRMYPPMFRHFVHVLRDRYGLENSTSIDMYEQVGMFLCILAHGKGYRQVQTLFGHSLHTVGHYFKRVLRAVSALAADMIRPHENYNRGAGTQDCIGAIDGTHVRAVLPRRKRINFIGRKGVPTQNVLAACDFNLCFTFVLSGSMGPTHDSRILVRAVHSPDIHFSEPADRKYYLVDSGFAHRPGYMAPYKGSDVRYHFQEFHDHGGGRRRFRNARERFNFHHSSCRNIIERAFGVLKQRWKILDRMPSYSYRAQIAVVVAAMGVHNFLRRNGELDEGFHRAEEVDDEEVEVDLPDDEDEVAAEEDAVANENATWTQLRDYIAHTIR
ncbi:uncharacterized protein LOC111392572 [Olea europaea var. sylvestris]|uniref:uncharacterized protein LOC111392572 n=1 Tax=Olea europaea var. sylvestris TaxID=158386 RepID=UPI000C1D4A7E|nr:uncharacterized protein LOC111392572 [Olea europaea var. sylvestris]